MPYFLLLYALQFVIVLSEETLAFLGNDFDSVTDRSFPRDKIAIVLEELTIQVKKASKIRKITEYNLIRLAVKKYLKNEENIETIH